MCRRSKFIRQKETDRRNLHPPENSGAAVPSHCNEPGAAITYSTEISP